MVAASIHFTRAELNIVQDILRLFLPPEVTVWAFGSRVTGTHKPYSDLDLIVESPAPLTLAQMADLREAFEYSALPWKVDIIDKASTSEEFKRIIENQKVKLYPP